MSSCMPPGWARPAGSLSQSATAWYSTAAARDTMVAAAKSAVSNFFMVGSPRAGDGARSEVVESLPDSHMAWRSV